MGQQIVKQPNGKYCIYSTIVEDVIHYDLNKEDIIDHFLAAEKKRISRDVTDIIFKIEKGESPYGQNWINFKDLNPKTKKIIKHGIDG